MKFGAVAIGRNEGARLARCLESLSTAAALVYVDSGSTDGSAQLALDHGADVIELDMTIPFTAARARNAGFKRIREIAPDLLYVQFIDGDSELIGGWAERALSFMEMHADVGAACGRLHERHPERSIYNWLCEREWERPVGEVRACGGIALMRVKALEAVGGFREDLIAGEEPELCVRLRAKGWRIWRLDTDMALHDAAMNRFASMVAAQYAKRLLVCARRLPAWSAARTALCLGVAPTMVLGDMFAAGLPASRTYVRILGLGLLADLSIACGAKSGSQPRPLAGIARCWQRSTYWDTFRRVGARSSSCATVCSGARRALSNTNDITMRVAYLVNQYPAVSHSFIRREILALERQGVEIVRVCAAGLGQRTGWRRRPARARSDTLCPARRRAGAAVGPGAHALHAAGAPTAGAGLGVAIWAGARTVRCQMHFVYLAEACRSNLGCARPGSSIFMCISLTIRPR